MYFVRAPRVSQTEDIYQRICDIARGAALMTGTEVNIDLASALSNVIPNTTLEQVMHENFIKLGVPSYTDEELQFARAIRETLSEEEKRWMCKEIVN